MTVSASHVYAGTYLVVYEYMFTHVKVAICASMPYLPRYSMDMVN